MACTWERCQHQEQGEVEREMHANRCVSPALPTAAIPSRSDRVYRTLQLARAANAAHTSSASVCAVCPKWSTVGVDHVRPDVSADKKWIRFSRTAETVLEASAALLSHNRRRSSVCAIAYLDKSVIWPACARAQPCRMVRFEYATGKGVALISLANELLVKNSPKCQNVGRVYRYQIGRLGKIKHFEPV
jgi:hypothetical protein